MQSVDFISVGTVAYSDRSLDNLAAKALQGVHSRQILFQIRLTILRSGLIILYVVICIYFST
jgi:hypothetical protein